MNSIAGRNRSQIFQVNPLKSSYSRNSKLSSINENDNFSSFNISARPLKRGRLSSKSLKNGSKRQALFDFKGYAGDELSFSKGEEIQIISRDDTNRANWWKGRAGGKEGVFPSMYVSQNRMGIVEVREIDNREIFLRELIGKGGFSTVHLGTWKNKDVAVKIIVDSSGDKDSIREAFYYWLLRHPNIISLLGVCKHPSEYWLVMEYARGGSLAQILSENFLPLHIVIDWSTQIAKAMKYLHQDAPLVNIVHRDLKTRNILIFEAIHGDDFDNKTLKITDFGLARHDFQSSLHTELAGTFTYMAPEAIRDHHISAASDVWSYGVVLWEILTSQIPFKNFNQWQLLMGIGKNLLRLPIPKSFPEPFQELLEKCWKIDPKERPPFVEILKFLQSTRPSVVQIGTESFKALQQGWASEMEEEMETIKSESVNTMSDDLGGSIQEMYESFVEKVTDGINRRYKQLEQLQLDIVAKQLYYAILQETITKKHKKRFKNFFSWRKKGSLKIGMPSNFQHKLQTIVEETKIFPKLSPNVPSPRPFTFRTIRVNTNASQEDVQKTSLENLHLFSPLTEYSIVAALRKVMSTAACFALKVESPELSIIPNGRGSLLPTSSAQRPTTLDIKPFYQADQPVESREEIPSSGDQKTSPFKVKIVQTHSKSRVYITGNNPEENNYMTQSVFKANDDNQNPLPSNAQSGNSFVETISCSPPSQTTYDSSISFPSRIGLYGSFSTLTNRAENQTILAKISFVPNESFPNHKVNQRQSLLNLKEGKKVAELRAFFSQKPSHDKLIR